MSKLLILGAGASFGNGVRSYLKPPLVTKFFDNRFLKKYHKHYKPLFNILNKSYNISDNDLKNINIEELLELVEPFWELEIFKDNKIEILDRYGEGFDIISPLYFIKSWIVDIIYYTTIWLKNKTCPLHDKIVKNWLNNGDFIISFNYDLIIDKSLKLTGNWNENTGYGWIKKENNKFVYNFLSDYEKDDYQVNNEAGIILLKLHGSLNWFHGIKTYQDPVYPIYNSFGIIDEKKEKREVKQREYINIMQIDDILKRGKLLLRACPRFYETLTNKENIEHSELFSKLLNCKRTKIFYGILPLIIFPTPYKSLIDMKYAELRIAWEIALRVFETVDSVVSIGFSFNDRHFNSIIAEGTRKRKKPLAITIIDPKANNINESKFKYSKVNLKLKIGKLEDFVKSIN